MNQDKIKEGVRLILEGIGEDVDLSLIHISISRRCSASDVLFL